MSLQRTSPLRRRRPGKPRRIAERCSVRGCRRRPNVLGECRTHAKMHADTLFSRFIRNRDGRCMAAEAIPAIRCSGALQCMHLVSRRYLAVRWSPVNATSGCAAHHKYLTEHPLEHDRFCERILGRDRFRALQDTAMHSPPADLAATLGWLREQVAA